jgi:carboxypeptidase C (cathepsin A)
MGSFGPMRLQTGNPEAIRPAPFNFGANPDTLLGTTDMVFIDAPGTGYSRPLGDAKGSDFYGVDQDADAFARAIMRYVSKFSRWDSPKFLFGESYGTTRSGALAYQLQDRGMALNGVVLLSSIMNYGRRQPGLDRDYINYIPSYAATAWYHHKMANPPATVAEAAAEARAFAQGPYAAALEKGQTISPQERDAVARQMSALTGLSPEFIERANLRVDLSRFRKELLRNERETIGRYDSRYLGVDTDAAGESPETDPSDTAISGAFIGTLHDYLARDLNYQTNMAYRPSASEEEGFKWDWNHKAPGIRFTLNTPDTALDLAAAMRTNPYLKVLSLNGWYDMATPFFGTEYDLNHMMLEPAQQRNLEFRYYPSGHMVYLNPDALHAMRLDVERFVDEAVAAAGTVPAAAPRPSRHAR